MFGRLKNLLGQTNAAAGDGYLDGAYRRHQPQDVQHFTDLAIEAFPDFANRITCFGSDWLGRQFATDTARIADGEPQVLMLEPGTGEVLEIPVDYAAFHARELVAESDALIAFSFFRDWRASGGAVPGYRQCVGYKVPLFLNGSDDLTNLELTNFEVYWTISAQLLARVRAVPTGVPIGGVAITE